MTTRIIERVVACAGIVALAASLTGQAAWAANNAKINEVFVDFANDLIVITGEGFSLGPGPLEVTLGDAVNGAGPGDISTQCAGPPAPTENVIVCDTSAINLPDGDYLLGVARGGGQSQSVAYDVTISEPGQAPSLNVVLVQGPSVTLTSGIAVTDVATVRCPAGTIVVGGGHQVSNGNGFFGLSVGLSLPFVQTSQSGWQVRATYNGGSPATLPLTAFALCADVGVDP